MEHASSLPKQLDESSRAALQASLLRGFDLNDVAQAWLGNNSRALPCLQGYVRQSMQQMLVALSPNIGVAAEHLLSEYQQLTSPAAAAEACTSTALGQTLGRRALASWTSSKLQLAFEHECL